MNKKITLTVLVGEETAVVEATAPTFSENGEGSITGTGWAKKHPKDQPDTKVGYNVAMARALRDLADEYDKRAEELMANPILTRTTSYLNPLDGTTFICTTGNFDSGTLRIN